jgi:hypothetical protein
MSSSRTISTSSSPNFFSTDAEGAGPKRYDSGSLNLDEPSPQGYKITRVGDINVVEENLATAGLPISYKDKLGWKMENVYFGDHMAPVYLARTSSEPTDNITNELWRHRTPSGLKLEGYFHYTTTGGTVWRTLENHQVYITAVFGVVREESLTVSDMPKKNLLDIPMVEALYESYANDCHDLEEVVFKFLTQVSNYPKLFLGNYVLDPRPDTVKIVVLSDGPLSN